MAFKYALCDTESEASALTNLFGGKKGLHNFIFNFSADSLAAVGDANNKVLIRLFDFNRNPFFTSSDDCVMSIIEKI